MPLARAHRLDEYLQATLIGLNRNGVDVEINLTPGVAVLPAVMAAIDRNGDGSISVDEAQAYSTRVIREVGLTIDGQAAPLSFRESSFPKVEEMRQGLGTIRLKLRTSRTGHELRFENRHLPQISAYLVNCLAAPGDGLTVAHQERDELQKSIRFDYVFEGGPAPSWPKAPLILAALATILAARLAGLSVKLRANAPEQRLDDGRGRDFRYNRAGIST
jgi:hypothetical protein